MATRRPKISNTTQSQVLSRCARRCCICVALNNDKREKTGQIAHLDQNSANNNIGNLAWLCLEHHDQYDSRTSQSKGLTRQEVKKYRTQLHKAVSSGQIPDDSDPIVYRIADYLDQSTHLNVSGSGNIVSGGDIHVNIKTTSPKRKKSEKPIISGTVAEDARLIGYLKYLARRYNEFKKWHCSTSGEKMVYPLIYNSYRNEIKYSITDTPRELFDKASKYLHKRLLNTKLGRILNKQNRRVYRTFDQFDDRTKPDEDIDVD
jgi:hypothetical protein